jgi:hypothetical protein
VRVAGERRERNIHRIELEMEEWNPFADEQLTSDPEKTLLVARLSFKTTEKTLKYEFEVSLSPPRSTASLNPSASFATRRASPAGTGLWSLTIRRTS